MRIKKDDTVIVLAGKDKGTIGKVLKAMPKEGKVIVEGVNVQTKHQKQTQKEAAEIKHQEGKIVEFEVSPTTGKIEDMYGPMFGGPANSPSIFPGFGKVISMTQTI